MFSLQKYVQSSSAIPPLSFALGEPQWYAVHTVARHEKRVTAQFLEKQIFTFLPLLQQMHRWSDRQSRVEVPLFSCYTFVCIAATPENRANVLRTSGVLGFVGNQRQGTSIPEQEIESLRTAIRAKVPCVGRPFIVIGKRVRILGGCLDGMEGILEQAGADQSLIVSVELLQRSVSIRVNGYDVELI